uniref:Membrane protein involved in the export of O-antigen and teichoic acid n=1 Tax=Candidatus Kentrum sp. FM TaxID=2126340 RepID=A0A450S3P1_9GAMM|nr:MAG: Membrane protein involved in the export of O-antigen and teichoic acid [Candidatus Kentron sp. FM]VFJ49540.1 MAG: Membrane protein involved in the export of O-antigen and teichoic acid [Candidatus Kentron sp. FM]VFK07284.1 MAG: Membrane protein involved in the export of O-antigen and teichoic acid [Candidatus Kentron sp. FM]
MKAAIQRLLPKNRFARSVSVLAGGTVAGQAIVVLASPVLTRLYTPEDFGLLAVFASLLGILSVVVGLRYELAIPLPENEDDATSIAALNLLIVLGMTALCMVFIVLFRAPVADLLNAPALEIYLWLLPVGLLFFGIYQVLSYWAIRTKEYPAIALTKLTQAIGITGIQVCGYALGPLALILGQVIGQGLGVVALARKIKKPQCLSSAKDDNEVGSVEYSKLKSEKNDAKRQKCCLCLGNIKHQASAYREFPLLATWTGLASAAGMQLIPLLIFIYFGGAAAGYFSITHRIMSLPMSVMGQSVGDVFYREAVDAYRQGTLGALVIKTNKILIVMALPVVLFGSLIAPQVFYMVFGAEWKTAGVIAQCIAPWMFLQFITTPSTRIYPILGKHKLALLFQVSFFLFSIMAIGVGSLVFESFISCVLFLSLGNSIIYLVRLLVSVKLAGGSPLVPLSNLANHGMVSILACSPLVILYAYSGDFHGVDKTWASMVLVTLVMVTISIYRLLMVKKNVN